MQELGLNLQKISLNSDGTADTPEQGCKTEHELAFDGCSGVVICNDGCFERLIVLNIFQSDDDSFGRQTMSDCIVPRSPFSVFGPVLLSALRRLASICRNEVIPSRDPRSSVKQSSLLRRLAKGSPLDL